MNIIYTYSTVEIRWNLDADNSYGLSSSNLCVWYTVGHKKQMLTGTVSGGVFTAEIQGKLEPGVYNLFAELRNSGAVVFEEQAMNAFAVTEIQREAWNADGSKAIINIEKDETYDIVEDSSEYGLENIQRLPRLYAYGNIDIVWDMEREFNVRPELKTYDVRFTYEICCKKTEVACDIEGDTVRADINGKLKPGVYNCYLTFEDRGNTVIEMQSLTAFVVSDTQESVMNPDGATVTLHLRSGRVVRAVVTPLVDPTDIAFLGDLFDVDLKGHIPTLGEVLLFDGTKWVSGKTNWENIANKPTWLTNNVPDLGVFGNNAGYIKGINRNMIISALGYTPLESVRWGDVSGKPTWITNSTPDLEAFSNKAGYIKVSDITRSVIVNALGYDPSGGVQSLRGLSDVSIGAVMDGYSLVYDGASGKWVARYVNSGGGGGGTSVMWEAGTTSSSVKLNVAGNVKELQLAGNYMTWEEFNRWFQKRVSEDGVTYIYTEFPLASKSDVSGFGYGGSGEGGEPVQPTSIRFGNIVEVGNNTWENGQTLIYNNGNWVPGNSGGAKSFADLTDVTQPSGVKAWGWTGYGYGWIDVGGGGTGGEGKTYTGSTYVKVDNVGNIISLQNVGTCIKHDEGYFATVEQLGNYALKTYVDNTFQKKGNQYWANLSIQENASTDTTPQFGRVGIGQAVDKNYGLIVADEYPCRFNYYIDTKSIYPIENNTSNIGKEGSQYNGVYAQAFRNYYDANMFISQNAEGRDIEFYGRENGTNKKRLSISSVGNVGVWSDGTAEWLRFNGSEKKIYLSNNVAGTSKGTISWDSANNAFRFEGNIYATGDVAAFGAGITLNPSFETLAVTDKLTIGSSGKVIITASGTTRIKTLTLGDSGTTVIMNKMQVGGGDTINSIKLVEDGTQKGKYHLEISVGMNNIFKIAAS